MSISAFTASAGGAKLVWEVIKGASNVVFDSKEPAGKRVTYGVGGVATIGLVGYAAYLYLPAKSS